MTTERRRDVRRRPDGSLWDEAAFRDYLAQMTPPPLVRVERLSIVRLPR
jgi:hypothetical protein